MEVLEEPTKEFLIREIRKPIKKTLENEINWFCKCLGFMEPRDKERTAIAIFKEILYLAREGKKVTSLYLMKKLNLSRGIVVYYLNKLLMSGLRVGNEYELRERNLEETFVEVERDMQRTMLSIKEVARKIDEKIKLPRK
jgi:hypothetical protein